MDIQEILNKAIVQAEHDAVATSSKMRLIDVFRNNYDDWNGRLFPAWKKVGKVCHRELALLLNQVGFVTVNDVMVARYMKLVRDERKKAKHAVPEQSKPAVTLQAAPPAKPVAVVVETVDDHDWTDTSWLGEEPDWGMLIAPGAARPKVAQDWDSNWENVWRWLYRLADDHGLNSFDRTVYAGFKKISASTGDLWLDLSKVRRLMNGAGMLLDPKGIGTKCG